MYLLPSRFLTFNALLRRASRLSARLPQDALAAVDLALAKLAERRARAGPAKRPAAADGAPAHILRGRVLRQLGRGRDAAEALLEAAPHARLEPDLLDFLATQLLASQDRRPKSWRVYLDYLSTPRSRDPTTQAQCNLRALEHLARPAGKPGQPDEEARRWNAAAAAARPDLPWPRLHLGQMAAQKADWTAAVRELEHACGLAPHGRTARRLLAYALARLDRLDEARTQLDALLAKDADDVPALLLRSHVLRRFSEPAAASRDLQRARVHGAFPASQLLALAETLIASGETAAARQVLADLPASSSDDPRSLLALAAIARAEGRPAEAASTLRRILQDREVGNQATAAVVAVAATAPSTAGAREALETVPEHHRDDRYWTALGSIQLAVGRPQEALGSWNQIAEPSPLLESRRRDLLAHHLERLQAAGHHGALLSAVTSGLASQGDPDTVAAVAEGALMRQLHRALPGDSGSRPLRKLLRTLDGVAAAPPLLGRSARLTRLKGLLLDAMDEHEACVAALSPRWRAGDRDPEVVAALLRSAVWAGERKLAAEIVAASSSTSGGWHRSAAAYAALDGNWQAAADHLVAAGTLKPDAVLAAVFLRAGRPQLVDLVAGEGATGLYHRAAATLQQGNRTAALKLIAAISVTDSWRQPADRLAGWASLAEARDHFRAGRQRDALAEVAEAIRRWPGDDGPLSLLAGSEEIVLPALLAAELRPQALLLLERRARTAGVADPAACRHLALFHLAEASRLNVARAEEDALRHYERSIACLSVALAHTAFVESWAEERSRAYGATAPAEAVVSLGDRIAVHCERLLQLRTSPQPRTRSSSPEQDLGLLLRAERHGARLLRQAGGAPIGAGGESLHAGPTFIALAGLAPPFGAWLEQTAEQSPAPDWSSPPANIAELLARLAQSHHSDDPGALPAGTKRSLERAFSSLRLVVTLHRDGSLQQGLDELRRPERPCFPLAGGAACSGTRRRGCPSARERFLACNPAFAGDGGHRRFREAVAHLELDLLVELGDEAIASPSPQHREGGVKRWREALELAGSTGRKEELAARIRKTVLGRIQVLAAADREEEGIELLEALAKFHHDGELSGALAMLYAQRAIERVNESDEWKDGVRDLRRARELNPHSPHVNLNLIRALLGHARELQRADAKRAQGLLREAVTIAGEGLAADPHNGDLQEAANDARAALAVVSFDAPAGGENFEALLAAMPGGAARLSTLYHNRGLAKARAGQADDGIRDLQRALDLEPGSPETRTALVGLLNSRAVELANGERFDDALRLLHRGLKLSSSDATLRRNRNAVARAKEIRDLTSRQASPQSVQRLLQLLGEDD